MIKKFLTKNDFQKIFIVALALVGFSTYVFSAPGTNPSAGDIAPLINPSNDPQSKNCGAAGLAGSTLSVCHDAGTASYGFSAEGIASHGPIVTDGPLIANLSLGAPSGGQNAGPSPFFDALRLSSGQEQNITTITLGTHTFNPSGPSILGVWSNFLGSFAEGRLGRLDAEKLILTEKDSFASWTFGPLRSPANYNRTVSYTSSVGALPNIDIAGTTNLGHGNYCHRKYRDCSGGANSSGGGNMYISRIGVNYTTCRDIDPAEFPQVADMSDPGYFTCEISRTAPSSTTTSIRYMPSYGFEFNGQSGTLCAGSSYGSLVSTTGGQDTDVYINSDDIFHFGTMVFSDPYLERPISDGWHAGGFSNTADFPNYTGNKWFETKQGAITRIGQCTSAPGTFWFGSLNVHLYPEQ
jgi:hypothetical protein